MPEDDRNKFGASFAFEYRKIIAKVIIFHRFKKFFELLIFFNIAKSSFHGSSAILPATQSKTFETILLLRKWSKKTLFHQSEAKSMLLV